MQDQPNTLSPILSQREAAEILGVSPRTLEAWRYRGSDLKYIRISSRCIRYRLSDVLEWQAQHERFNTVSAGGEQ